MRRIRKFLLIGMIFVVCCASTVFADGVYKWTDADGKVHYGDRPQEQAATPMPIEPPPPPDQEVARRRQQQGAALKQYDKEQAARKAQDDRRKKASRRIVVTHETWWIVGGRSGARGR